MIIAIQKDKIGDESYSDRWSAYLQAKGVQVRWVDLYASNALEQIKGCDALFWRTTHPPEQRQIAQKILYTVERYLNIPVYPNHDTYWHYDEKLTQHYILQSLDIPTPKTWVFWNEGEALQWAKQAQYPVVFKLSVGASSNCVRLVYNQDEAEMLIKRMFKQGIYPSDVHSERNLIQFGKSNILKNFMIRIYLASRVIFLNENPEGDLSWQWRKEKGYAYFQEYVQNNDGDTRITIIGNRIFGFKRLNRDADFRASGSGKIDFDPEKVDKRCIQIAFDISQKLKCQSVAYDFLFKDGVPVVNEVSYTFLDSAIAKCPGYWTPDLEWIEGSYWPEDLIMEDFLKEMKSS